MSVVWEGHADILESHAQTLVLPANARGIMGKGLALQFKERYPKMFEAYVRDCQADLMWQRGYFLYKVDDNRFIYCFPTKKHWRDNSRIEWIHQGLIKLTEVYRQEGIEQLAVPALGCGEGHLEWVDVYPLMYGMLDRLDAEVGIHLPYTPKR